MNNPLREVALEYANAYESYRQAMARGDTDRADSQMSEMQRLERETTVIRHTQRVERT